ncbi:MAG: cupin domain-containing protein [Bacteroidota bacterium]
MTTTIITCGFCLFTANVLSAQPEPPESPSVYKIPQELLAGEGLDPIEQSDSSRVIYQKRVYDGEDLAIFMLAIGTGITNEFQSFPMEEFIFWMNGKAVVEPVNEAPFEVHSGDFFVQAKGFKGKWNFVDNGGLHLELALVAKNRPDSTVQSPISHALVIDRDIISGVSELNTKKEVIYQGVELTVNRLSIEKLVFENDSQERMIHVLNGILSINTEGNNAEQHFYPGDFLVIPAGFRGTLVSHSLQAPRVLEVFKTKDI